MKKVDAFAQICTNISSLSYDDKYKVGSIIFSNNFRVIHSTGYNGNYSGGPNERDSMASGDSGFIHAELNALLKFGRSAHDEDVIMCTMTPCWHCAKCIANSGIKRALFITNYSKDREFEKIFDTANIKWAVLDSCDHADVLKVLKSNVNR